MAQNIRALDSQIKVTAPARTKSVTDRKPFEGLAKRLSHRRRNRREEHAENGQIPMSDSDPSSLTANVYLGSYRKSLRNTPQTSGNTSKCGSRQGPLRPSPRASTSHLQLEHLLDAVDVETDTFGVEEMRDGFFDALFYKPSKHNHDEMYNKAFETLPVSFKRQRTLSRRQSLVMQWTSLVNVGRDITTTRSGIKLIKSFLGFFIAYVICLIPMSRDWLGRYNYILVVSAIINHPGRALGSQIDGSILTILGTAAGLGWGSLALYVSTSTFDSKAGYGGILATFLILFTAVLAWLRCVFIRFYQAVICAGIAICYTCLADTSKSIGWAKIAAYGIPWVLGQAIGLMVSFLFLPAAGSRPLAIAFHSSLEVINAGLRLPRSDSLLLKRELARHFVNLSQTVRDFTIDMSISRFDPEDIRSLRNALQRVIRSSLAIRPQTTLFNHLELFSDTAPEANLEGSLDLPFDPTLVVCKALGLPTWRMLEVLKDAISRVDAVIMDISGHRTTLGPPSDVSSNISQVIEDLTERMADFDNADDLLECHIDLPSKYSDYPKMIELFLFIHPVRQLADRILSLLYKTAAMQQKDLSYTVRLPSYPFSKSLLRNNAQVRHDRGGLTASFYFRSIGQLNRTMKDLQSREFKPRPHQQVDGQASEMAQAHSSSFGEYGVEDDNTPSNGKKENKIKRLRHGLWSISHRLQGFESRFALKAILVTTLLSIPAWLPSSRDWWNDNESWWVVVTVWLSMHPRVGGNFQDLFIRMSCAILGCVWGGFAYGARNGNPYVMAVFALLFMIPMLYRFTQSSHPRSGFIACLSFTVVSLIAYSDNGRSSTVDIAWTRGLAFVIGTISAIIVNWVLWPFIARHELRKSLSTMMLHSAILYRGVVAKYIYYTEGDEPGPEDVARSEMLEGRLREGFVRIRQLMELTRHEIRLRAPFDPLPYSALIQSCENLFGHLVEVRQSSLYFQPHMLASDEKSSNALFTARRDAVATILMNLYVLAGALRSHRPVPRYMPSSAAARQRLLDKMEEVEAKQKEEKEKERGGGKGRRWADVYHYAFSEALAEVVGNVQELAYFTKVIVGEAGFGSGTVPA